MAQKKKKLAPDEGHSSEKHKKMVISLRLDEQLLSKIDAVASQRGISRNALISYWCSKALEEEKC